MKILLIEDDIFFQKFYTFKLTEKGHQIEIGSNGEEGIMKLQQFQPDIILLDLVMPKKDGFAVLSELRKNPAWSAIPVLVFSTLEQKQDVERAKQLGARDYVNKSFFDFENLLKKLEAVAGTRTV